MEKLTYEEFDEKYPERSFGERGILVVKNFNWDRDGKTKIPTDWNIELDHSCDRWVVGNLAEAEAFKLDLEAAIDFIIKNS